MASRVRAASLSSTTTVTTSGASDAAKVAPARPRLSSHNKRVSFDAISIPLPSSSFDEVEGDSGPSSNIPPPTPIASIRGDRLRAGRRPDIDSRVDLKAVLAAGINAWRTEVEAEAQEE